MTPLPFNEKCLILLCLKTRGQSIGHGWTRMHTDPNCLAIFRTLHPVPFARRKYSVLIEPAIYLNALIRDFQLAGGKIAIREFRSVRELTGLRETLIFNCTGLG